MSGSPQVLTCVPQSQTHRVWADLGLKTGKLIRSLLKESKEHGSNLPQAPSAVSPLDRTAESISLIK